MYLFNFRGIEKEFSQGVQTLEMYLAQKTLSRLMFKGDQVCALFNLIGDRIVTYVTMRSKMSYFGHSIQDKT